jgi:predicted ribosome quality control (RQC) complex YloA/Tae2 family protein
MKFEDIKRAATEMGEGLCGCRIEKVYQLEPHSFLFQLYRNKRRIRLIVSVKKNARRYHFITERIDPAYLYSSPSVGLLSKWIIGARIQSGFFLETGILLTLDRDGSLRILIDFKENNILLVDEQGQMVFQLHGGGNPPGDKVLTAEGAGQVLCGARRKGKPVNMGEHFPTVGGQGASFNVQLSKDYIEERDSALGHKILKILRGEKKKVEKLLEKLSFELQEVSARESYRRGGDLIKYNLADLRRGMRSVILTDFNGEEVDVELDPELTPHENMQRYFDRYRKLKRKAEIIGRKIDYETGRLRGLDEIIGWVRDENLPSITRSPGEFIQSVDTFFMTKKLAERIRLALNVHGTEKTKKTHYKRALFLQFTSRTGKSILVGRNATENENLSLRIARGNDLWFHVEAGSGSHVVLRYDRKGEFQDSDILDAGMLALHFSRHRNEKAGSVVYARCKYVQKLKNGREGQVTYSNNRSKWVVMESEVLQMLLKAGPASIMQIS